MTDAGRFELPEELEEFRSLVRRIAEDKIAPRAAEVDRSDEWPKDIYKVLVANDLMATGYPPEDGGSGGGASGHDVDAAAAVCRDHGAGAGGVVG